MARTYEQCELRVLAEPRAPKTSGAALADGVRDGFAALLPAAYARYEGKWPGKIEAYNHKDATFDIAFKDGDKGKSVPFQDVDILPPASAKRAKMGA